MVITYNKPSARKLSIVIKKLSNYFELESQVNIFDKMLSNHASLTDNQKQSAQDLLHTVGLDLSSGGKFVSEIKANIEQASVAIGSMALTETIKIVTAEEIKEYCKIAGADAAMEEFNAGTTPTRLKPHLVAMHVNEPKLSPAYKGTAAVEAFMNTIPTHEFSRAVPFIKVDIHNSSGKSSYAGKKPTRISLIRFLEGHNDVHENFSKDPVSPGAKDSEGDPVPDPAGMEMFLSPQTLVSSNTAAAGRPTQVLDRFQPFMSIMAMDLAVTSAGGTISFKLGTLTLRLHDRSRMWEIADLVNPDLYSQTTLMITFGWSHPDNDPERNVFGTLINQMQTTEKYMVSNVQFTMQGPEVNMILHIAMLSGPQMSSTCILDDMGCRSTMRVFRQNAAVIRRMRQSNPALQQKLTALGAPNIINDSSLYVKAPKSVLDEQQKFMTAAKSSPDGDLTALAKALKEWGNSAKEAKQSVKDARIKKMKHVKREFDGRGIMDDPFLFGPDNPAKTGKKNQEFLSLGEVYAFFVGMPFWIEHKNTVSEIQLIFYPMNSSAGRMRNKNISEFYIDAKNFGKYLKAVEDKHGHANIKISDFLQHMNNMFINDISNLNYGLSTFYSKNSGFVSDLEAPEITRQYGRGRRRIRPNEFEGRVSAALQSFGIASGQFQPPQVAMHMEHVPWDSSAEAVAHAANLTPTQTAGLVAQFGQTNQSILRIHIYDKTESPYSQYVAMYENSMGMGLPSVNDSATGSAKAKAEADMLARAQELGMVESYTYSQPVDNEDGDPVMQTFTGKRFPSTPDATKIKRFLASKVPYIRYASSATAILSAEFASMQNEELNTIHLVRNNQTGDSQPLGQDEGGIPLMMQPTSMRMELLGCPLINFMQQFFIDFDTGTNIDNVYQAYTVAHKLDPSGYTTSVELFNMRAYGRFRSFYSQLGQMVGSLQEQAGITDANSPE